MTFFLSLPFQFVSFWFFEAPLGLIRFFTLLNSAFIQLCSIKLLLRTFFRPWKNEYREGLIGFSIGMGMAVKSLVLFASFCMLAVIVVLECISILLFTVLPIVSLVFLFSWV